MPNVSMPKQTSCPWSAEAKEQVTGISASMDNDLPSGAPSGYRRLAVLLSTGCVTRHLGGDHKAAKAKECHVRDIS